MVHGASGGSSTSFLCSVETLYISYKLSKVLLNLKTVPPSYNNQLAMEEINDSKFVIFAFWSFSDFLFYFVLLHAVNLHFIHFSLYLPAKAGLLLKEVLLVPPFYIFFQYFRAECDSLKGFPILKIKFS